MTILDRFTPAARQAIVNAGLYAADAGHPVLSPEFLLLALADARPLAGRPEGLNVNTAAVHREIARQDRYHRRRDHELLAAIGIDDDEVRRRARIATGVRVDDPDLWTLRRSALRPLRVTLHGPASSTRLDQGSRKVIEVATWACRRGRRRLADREDLLWGLLADSSQAVQILRRLNADLRSLWGDLQRWHLASKTGH